jgi:hypothetical protein
VRSQALLTCALAAVTLAAPAVAQAPLTPHGNFGGGAVAAPPHDILGAGSAIVALRALPRRRLEIEATAEGRCGGGDITATTKVSTSGRFAADGTVTTDPSPLEKVTTTYTMSGRFTQRDGAEGTLSATIERSIEGATKSCRSGRVAFSVRRPTTGLGTPGAPKASHYYGTTTQRAASGPSRPIVLRISADGERITRALYGESVKCSDGSIAIGIDGPSTNITLDARGRVRDHEHFQFTQGETVTHVDDHFTAQLGRLGGRGTISLSDRTADRASGRTIQTCASGTMHWRASR